MRVRLFNLPFVEIPPPDLVRGAVAGLFLSNFVSLLTITLPNEYYGTEYSSAKVLGFILACTLIGAGWGLHNELRREQEAGPVLHLRR